MPHVFEAASSGRAKCRACGRVIAKGEQRFGERLPNPYADGEMTFWFHPLCAAFRRPEPVLQALAEASDGVPERDALGRTAHAAAEHRRLQRVNGAERAPSRQAKCRQCREPIEKGTWRIRLVFFEEGRFAPGGFVHIDCRKAYFEDHDALEAILHFSAEMSDEERKDLERVYRAPAAP